MEYVSNGGCARPRGASVRIVGVREASAKGGPSQFLDVSKGLVSAADAAAIDQKARQAQAKIGAKAFVVAVRADEDVESYRPLYKELGMDGRDIRALSKRSTITRWTSSTTLTSRPVASTLWLDSTTRTLGSSTTDPPRRTLRCASHLMCG